MGSAFFLSTNESRCGLCNSFPPQGAGLLSPHVFPNELKDFYDEMYPVYQAVFSCHPIQADILRTGKPMLLLYPLARHLLNKSNPQDPLPLAVFRTIEKNHYGDYWDTMYDIYSDRMTRRRDIHAPMIYMIGINEVKLSSLNSLMLMILTSIKKESLLFFKRIDSIKFDSVIEKMLILISYLHPRCPSL